MLIRCESCKQDYHLDDATKTETFPEMPEGAFDDSMLHWDVTCPLCGHEYELQTPNTPRRRRGP